MADCDNAGIEHISGWLKRKYDERKSKDGTGKGESESVQTALGEMSAKCNNECTQISGEQRARDSEMS